MEVIKAKIEKNENKIDDFEKQITDLMGKDPRLATFKEDRDYWNAEKAKLDVDNEKLRNQLVQVQDAARDLEIAQEKTKQAQEKTKQGALDLEIEQEKSKASSNSVRTGH